MKIRPHSALLLTVVMISAVQHCRAEFRHENFDREPTTWEGTNHRNKFFESKDVAQDFGYSASTRNAGGSAGEIGGRINPAAEPAFYGYRLPAALTFDSPMSATGRLKVPPGAGHCLFGFFNAASVDGWRTPNTVVVRINSRGETFHCHFEYCTARWRAGAGVIGEIVQGERISAKEVPSAQVYEWRLNYEPKGGGADGVLTFALNGVVARCEIPADHRRDGLTVTHFGLLPVLKAWDSPGEIWIDDVTVNGVAFDFSKDPQWIGLNNRRSYATENIRPKFNFGWSKMHHAGGKMAGELGGLIFRGDCREPHRMGCYGDRLQKLTFAKAIEARGKVAVLRAVSDSTASIGFYNSVSSMQTNPAQNQSTPSDYLGINIEGPSSEGFFFYPVYRAHGADGVAGYRGGKAPRIYPDGKVHDWFIRYEPDGGDGRGRITVGLDDQTCTLDLLPGDKERGTSVDRFGICTPWIDGNAVTVYFDDLTYTASQ